MSNKTLTAFHGKVNRLEMSIFSSEPALIIADYEWASSCEFPIHPVFAEALKTTPEVGTKLALSRHQVEILRKCNEDTSLLDLMAVTGRSDRTKFRHKVLNILLEEGLIEMTIPDKPRSSKQKYRLTPAGEKVLKELKNEKNE